VNDSVKSDGFVPKTTHPVGAVSNRDLSDVAIPLKRIESLIFLIRGQKVMLDRDLAELYGVETRVLNQAVRRNAKRFPHDFMFPLTREEIMRISQSVISSDLKYSKRVYAFTEQGVAMLSSVLHSDRAIAVNIAIMRTFARLRQFLAENSELARQLAEVVRHVQDHDQKIQAIFDVIRRLTTPPDPPRKPIGFHVRERATAYRVTRKGAAK
jgi:hypothetical protein